MNKQGYTKKIVLSGVLLAMAVLLKMIKIYSLPQGGSVTCGSLLPLLLLAYVYGWRWGALCGMIFGLLDFIIAPFFVHPVQFMLDYLLSYAVIAVVGIIRPLWLGGISAIILRVTCNTLSGVIFFASFAPPSVPVWQYSLLYNLSSIGVDGLVALIILLVLPVKKLINAMNVA